MAKGALVETTLPLNLPEPTAHPTGKLYDTRKPYTLPLTQEVALTRCLGPYTEIDRKLWATLVALAWDDLAKKRVHEVNARDIARLFRDLKGGEHGSAWVMASARRLLASRLDWEDEEEEGAVSLLAGLRIKKVSGSIFYAFSDFLIEKLLDNKQFSRLRLHFMIGLSGKYSVTLYMLLESAANMRYPVVEMPLGELRQVLSVPDGKLARWVDLNRFAIEPAVKQINDNALAAGFSVEVQTIMRGRKVERVRFNIAKTEARVIDESAQRVRISHRAEAPAAARPPAATRLPLYDVDAALAVIRREGAGLDAQAILREFDQWMIETAQEVKNVMGLLTVFARKKRKEYLSTSD